MLGDEKIANEWILMKCVVVYLIRTIKVFYDVAALNTQRKLSSFVIIIALQSLFSSRLFASASMVTFIEETFYLCCRCVERGLILLFNRFYPSVKGMRDELKLKIIIDPIKYVLQVSKSCRSSRIEKTLLNSPQSVDKLILCIRFDWTHFFSCSPPFAFGYQIMIDFFV
jgi:hypothetical protein